MSRETSPYIVGDYWLDKRRDGRAADIWQIAWYDDSSRCVVYRSTRKHALTDAKAHIEAHVLNLRTKGVQRVEEAQVIPLLYRYWKEHGKHTRSPSVIAYSLRQFIGFLMQDEAGLGLTVAAITPGLIKRFIGWRSKSHEANVPWEDGMIRNASKGVKGESIQRNIEDLRAALSHHVNEGRIAFVPAIPSVPDDMRSAPRDLVLTAEQMGAIIGFTKSVPADYAWIAAMIATEMRPEAALQFDPAKQWDKGAHLIDLHPIGAPRTKKRNPIIPAIPEFEAVMEQWPDRAIAKSKKTMWRTMRKALGLPVEAVPKTIRHTVATRIRALGTVPVDQQESLLGHRVFKGTSAVYAKYDPHYMAAAKSALSTIWMEWHEAAEAWLAVHMRTTAGNNKAVVVKRDVR